jgi:hypothetical protein
MFRQRIVVAPSVLGAPVFFLIYHSRRSRLPAYH